MRHELKIVSGGQTGADRAALDAALDAGAPCGGWCPADRSAEDGVIPARYPVQPLPRGGNDQRTRKNVIDSDGTVIFCFGPPFGGTETTRKCCMELAKPLLVVDAATEVPQAAVARLGAFVDENDIDVLNVAGPRASEQPEIGAYVYECIASLLAADPS